LIIFGAFWRGNQFSAPTFLQQNLFLELCEYFGFFS
jgi:hypothetical protein